MSRQHTQHGVVMVVTLLLLLVLSIMGLSAVSNATMEERMSGNFLHQTLAHQAAESAISSIVIAADPGRTAYRTDADLLAGAERADAAGVNLAQRHGTGGNAGLEIDSLSTVTYHGAGQGLCAGVSLNLDSSLGCHRYEVRTQAQTDSSGTRVSHLQGLVRVGPRATQ
jgi:hypothetical protein